MSSRESVLIGRLSTCVVWDGVLRRSVDGYVYIGMLYG